MKRTGKVYLVGAGPGDPGLVTVRGRDLLEAADVVVMDALVSPALVRGLRARVIDAGKRGPSSFNERAHGPSQEQINRLLVRLARAGDTVVRLKGGDPFVFGRGSEELEALRAAGIPFEVVPGVSSAWAVPAYAGIPVTDRRWASSVTFVTGHEGRGKPGLGVDWDRVSPRGTLVVMMGVLSWPRISAGLLKRGWPASTPVAAIERGATPMQRVLRAPLGASARSFSGARLSAPAIIVVGGVAALSGPLAWLSRERPLLGRRVMVTRSPESGDRLSALLEREGAEPVSCPLIRVRPAAPASLAGLRLAASAAALPYDWIVFLSANAVRIFSGLWPDAPAALAHVPAAAVGPQTAAAARAAGWRVKKIPAEFNGAAASRALGRLRGKRLLVPRARIAPPDLVRGIERAGGQADVLPIYETDFLPPDAAARSAWDAGVDAVTFLSASSVEAFAAARRRGAFRTGKSRVTMVSIGPSTSAAIRRLLGVNPVQAREATAAGVIDALRRVFKPK